MNDDFARALIAQHDDCLTVGRRTHGGSGAPRQIATLSRSGAVVTLCTQRVRGPLGVLIEGVGTPPDEPVTWRCEHWLEDADPDLDAALTLLDAAR